MCAQVGASVGSKRDIPVYAGKNDINKLFNSQQKRFVYNVADLPPELIEKEQLKPMMVGMVLRKGKEAFYVYDFATAVNLGTDNAKAIKVLNGVVFNATYTCEQLVKVLRIYFQYKSSGDAFDDYAAHPPKVINKINSKATVQDLAASFNLWNRNMGAKVGKALAFTVGIPIALAAVPLFVVPLVAGYTYWAILFILALFHIYWLLL